MVPQLELRGKINCKFASWKFPGHFNFLKQEHLQNCYCFVVNYANILMNPIHIPFIQSINQGGVRSFQSTDERACTDHMLAMEACKISNGGPLNSGTAEPFLDEGGYSERWRREFVRGIWRHAPPGNFKIWDLPKPWKCNQIY